MGYHHSSTRWIWTADQKWAFNGNERQQWVFGMTLESAASFRKCRSWSGQVPCELFHLILYAAWTTEPRLSFILNVSPYREMSEEAYDFLEEKAEHHIKIFHTKNCLLHENVDAREIESNCRPFIYNQFAIYNQFRSHWSGREPHPKTCSHFCAHMQLLHAANGRGQWMSRAGEPRWDRWGLDCS